MRRIDYKSGLLLSAATIPGAVLGAMTTGFIPRPIFDGILGIVMILVSAFLIWRPMLRGASMLAAMAERDGTDRLGSYNLPLGLGLSLVVGYVSSLLGIGGGIIHVPVLVHLLGFPVHVATATSHFILSFMSLAGTGVHVASGVFVHGVRRTIALAIGVVAGAQLGAWLSSRLRGQWIMRGLAVALGFVGLRVLALAFE
jgi:hypothetical protein